MIKNIILQSLLYQLKIIKQEVTANCHVAIFSLVVDTACYRIYDN